MAVSLEQFIQRVVDSTLMSADDITALLDAVPVEQQPQDGAQLARLLVKQKKLTAFQAQQIYGGKRRSLVLGNYVILDKLGEGGMGMVLKAQHRRMKRIVALKVLSPAVTNSPEAARRFQREVEAAAKLDHPNIVTAHDADEANGTHFLVMQYVEGTDLAVLVREQGSLSVSRAVSCVLQAARGLAYSHAHGVVHRDIKPSNLLLDRDGVVKILDMGIARLDSMGSEQDQLTGTGQMMGTVDYMAPEQALDSKSADGRADIYSLGITLWYLLTGRNVYEGDSVMSKLLAHRERTIPSLCSFCPQAPQELGAIFAKMVAKTPDARYQRMTEVIAQLERCIGESGSTPTIGIAPGEESRLNQFLGGLDSKAGLTVATQAAATKKATSPAVDQTLGIQSPQVDTDPQTQSLIAPRAAATTKASPPWWRRRVSKIAAGSGALALLVVAVVLFLPAKDGAIRVEISDPEIEVAINGTDVVLKKEDQGKDIRLSPGDHTLVVTRGDFKLETDKLILKEGETVTVHVDLFVGKVEVRQGETLLGQGQLPTVWHGWPADAPAPAVAPFSAEQAKKHQQAWADYLRLPVEHTNSVGIKLRLIPPGRYTRGSPPEEVAELITAAEREKAEAYVIEFYKRELPASEVVIEQPFYFGIYEVTQQQWVRLMGKNPSQEAGADNLPVDSISLLEAAEFCNLLSKREGLDPVYRAGGKTLTESKASGYRVPSLVEAQYAVRAGTTTKYYFGDNPSLLPDHAWLKGSSFGRSHPIGQKRPNPFGMFDVYGNLFELATHHPHEVTVDWTATYGGHFVSAPEQMRSAWSTTMPLDNHSGWTGLRVLASAESIRKAIAAVPPSAVAPFSAEEAKQHQKDWAAYLKTPIEYTNSLGMKFRLVPPGDFMMGGTPVEIEEALKAVGEITHWQGCVKSGAPQHKVVLSRPMYFGVHEVTQAQYKQVTGTNPSYFSPTGGGKESFTGGRATAHYPVDTVTWNDAAEFCAKLSLLEKLAPCYSRSGETVTRLPGAGYRLPTEAEWEFACRAGTTTKHWTGDKDDALTSAAWFKANWAGLPHVVGELKPNPLGLYDVHGNVWEWVEDWWGPVYYEQLGDTPAVDPSGPSIGQLRAIRSGDWFNQSAYCRSSMRGAHGPTSSLSSIGIRLVLEVDAVQRFVAAKAEASVAVDAKQQEIDLLAPMDPSKMDSANVQWRREGASLIGKGIATSGAVSWTGLRFPTSISGDYDVTIDLTQRGCYPLQIDLPLGDKAIRVSLAPNGGGLMQIDGKDSDQLAPPYRNTEARLKSDVKQRFYAQVRHGGAEVTVEVTLDGVKVGRFAGPRSRISLPHWVKPDLDHITMAAHANLDSVYLEFSLAVVKPIISVDSD